MKSPRLPLLQVPRGQESMEDSHQATEPRESGMDLNPAEADTVLMQAWSRKGECIVDHSVHGSGSAWGPGL